MSQQNNAKPSLQGVRIKARKGAVKASAKHEPQVFRDQLYLSLQTATPGDFDSYANQLITAGSTLELSKYADSLFELLLVGGLLQPGGTADRDPNEEIPFSLYTLEVAAGESEIAAIKKFVEVLNKLIRRYKYLQKPLETLALPAILQYINKWEPKLQERLAMAVAVMISTLLASTACLASLTKDHLTKDDVSINILTIVFRTYLADQTMDHLATNLKKGGIKDLLAFFPVNKRVPKNLDAHFRGAGLPQVADWFAKRQAVIAKETISRELKERLENDESNETIIDAIKEQQGSTAISDLDLVTVIWQVFMAHINWDATKPDQLEAFAVREISKYAPLLEPFSQASKTQIALINAVQVYCYENTNVMKIFPSILKVLYTTDCVSDKGIIYWHEKGSKPEGRQHFLKATESLVKFLREQEDDEDEDE